MKTKKDRSYLVILLLLLIIFISSYFLYENIHTGASGNDNAIVGTLTFKNKNIERKYDADSIWEKIDSGLLIRNRDTIRSGEFSDAVLTLTDKTKISINENSMIYVDITDNEINLNFAYGSMSLSKKSDGSSSEITLKIKSGNNTVEVKDSDIVLEKKGKDELSVQVNKGTAKFSSNGQEKEIKENESANFNGKEISVSEINLNLLSPEDAKIISEQTETIPVTFSWSTKNANQLRLEIAYDSVFKKVYKVFTIENNSMTASLLPGTYYWRISSEKNTNNKTEREFSNFRKLTLHQNSLPEILSPKNNQVFSFSSVTPIIPFNWKRVSLAKNYKLEISKNSRFTEIIKSLQTSQTFIRLDNLAAGTYYARVIAEPITNDFKQQKSESIYFSLEKKQELDAPILISPENEQELNSVLFSKTGFLFQVKDTTEVTTYTFQVSSQSNFKNLIIEQKSNSNQIKLKRNLEIGKYYWRAIGYTKDGRKTSYSEIRNFSIKENQVLVLLAPKNNSTLDIKKNPVTLQWKKSPYKTNFLVEVSNSIEFSNIIQSVDTEEYSWSHSFSKEGIYFWRVSILEGETILSRSEVFSFIMEDVRELIPIYPTKNQTVDMSPIDSLIFSWENNPKVDSYIFEFYKGNSYQQTLLVKAKIKNNTFLFKDLTQLDEGEFLWTLQEVFEREGNTQLGKKVIIPFSIYLSKKLSKPNIKTPEKIYVE